MRYVGVHLLLGLVALLAGCETTSASCWPVLEDKHIAFYAEFDRAEPDVEQLQIARRELKEALSSCSADEEFFSDNSRLGIGADAKISLLDMAIIADDREMTRAYATMLANEAPLPQSDLLLYGGEYLNLAAYFDSIAAIRELLDMGFDPNTAGEFGMTALHSSSVVSTQGLRVISELVQFGGNLEAKASNGETPIGMARRKGNLRKVQCLFLLGASTEDLDSQNTGLTDTGRKAVEQIDDFLNAANNDLPQEITKFCMASRLRSQSD